jgi:hypothetical protein
VDAWTRDWDKGEGGQVRWRDNGTIKGMCNKGKGRMLTSIVDKSLEMIRNGLQRTITHSISLHLLCKRKMMKEKIRVCKYVGLFTFTTLWETIKKRGDASREWLMIHYSCWLQLAIE